MGEAVDGAVRTAAPGAGVKGRSARLRRMPAFAERVPLRAASRVAQVVAGLALFGLVAYVARSEWQQVSETLSKMSVPGLVGAAALAAAGLFASVLVWRVAVAELGSRVSLAAAARIYLVGQLGKYVPGSLWALLIQTELARKVGVSRGRTLTASIVAILVNLGTGVAVGLIALPALDGGPVWRYALLGILLAGCIAMLNPPALAWSLRRATRLLRQRPPESTLGWRGLAGATAWSISSWVAYGLSLWVLVVLAGGDALRALPLCLSGIALAMTAGFLVVVAPSGIGVREAVVVAALAPVLAHGQALAVALVLRLIFTVVELLAAGAAAALRTRDPSLVSALGVAPASGLALVRAAEERQRRPQQDPQIDGR